MEPDASKTAPFQEVLSVNSSPSSDGLSSSSEDELFSSSPESACSVVEQKENTVFTLSKAPSLTALKATTSTHHHTAPFNTADNASKPNRVSAFEYLAAEYRAADMEATAKSMRPTIENASKPKRLSAAEYLEEEMKAATTDRKRKSSMSGNDDGTSKQWKMSAVEINAATVDRKRKSSMRDDDGGASKVPTRETQVDADAHHTRRVRRTPKEAVEFEERRVQLEIAAARERLASQKAKAVKLDVGAVGNAQGRTQQEVVATSDPRIVKGSKMDASTAVKVVAVAPAIKVVERARTLVSNCKALPHVSVLAATDSSETLARIHDRHSCVDPQVPTGDKGHAGTTKMLVAPAAKSQPATTSARQATTGKQAGQASPTVSSSKKPRKKKQTFDEQVLSHMQLSFKPFTLKTLAQELNSTDTIVGFSMLSMVDKNLVIKKDFPTASGNNVKTLYWANHGASAKELATSLATGEEIQVTKRELDELINRKSVIHKELVAVLETVSNEDLAQQLNLEQSQLDAMTQQLHDTKDRIRSQETMAPRPLHLGGRVPSKSATELARERCPRRLKIRMNNMRNEWKIRKDKCTSFVDTLADCMEKRPKDIIKLLDIETDEMIGVTMPPKQVLDNPR